MRAVGTPAATSVSSRVIFSATDIELASELVPNTASPTPCSSSQWQWLAKRSPSGRSSRSNGVTTGDKTPRKPGEFVIAILLLCIHSTRYLFRLVGREHSPGVDRLPDATAHLGECAGVRGGDLVLHLHGLDDEQHLPGLDRLARHGAHRQDR